MAGGESVSPPCLWPFSSARLLRGSAAALCSVSSLVLHCKVRPPGFPPRPPPGRTWEGRNPGRNWEGLQAPPPRGAALGSGRSIALTLPSRDGHREEGPDRGVAPSVTQRRRKSRCRPLRRIPTPTPAGTEGEKEEESSKQQRASSSSSSILEGGRCAPSPSSGTDLAV